jgi:hypothetical protein
MVMLAYALASATRAYPREMVRSPYCCRMAGLLRSQLRIGRSDLKFNYMESSMPNNNNITCPHCKRVFANPAQYFGTEALIKDNIIQCPYCRKSAVGPTISSRFDLNGNIIELQQYLSSKISIEELVRLQVLLDQVGVNPEISQNFTQEANKIASGLGDVINAYLGRYLHIIAVAAIILPIIVSIITSSSQPPVVNNITNITTNNYYGAKDKPKTAQVRKPRPGEHGSNLTPPKKIRKKRVKRK